MHFLFVLHFITDRSHGKQCTQQIEDLHHYLEEYVSNLEKEIKERQTQQELLEQSELFYDAQYGEAKIVTNVSLRCLLGIIERFVSSFLDNCIV